MNLKEAKDLSTILRLITFLRKIGIKNQVGDGEVDQEMLLVGQIMQAIMKTKIKT